MRARWLGALALGAIGAVSAGCGDRDARSLILATTTSVQDTGLLDSLLPPFEQHAGVSVKVIAVGTGAALEMARRGDADAVLVHALDLERAYVESGDLVGGRLVMENDFVLVGPPDDPAGARAASNLDAALDSMAKHGPFISRGDGSGTEARELALWSQAGIDPDSIPGRAETGQGQGATLLVANERRAYALTDRSTLLALAPRLSLDIVFEGDRRLLNEYRIYAVNPERHPDVAVEAGRALIDYFISPAAQELIGRFGSEKFGRPLFHPAAGG